MKHLMQKANIFSKINWACAVTLNLFVGFSKCVFGRQLYTNIFEKKLLIIIFFVWKCAWWGNAENGVGGKEMEFFLLNGIKLVKMHSDSTLIHLAINIYLSRNPLHHLKILPQLTVF